MKCPSCGSESRYHAKDCTLANKLNERLDQEAYAKQLVESPDEYRDFLKLSIAAHLIVLDKEARGGDTKAAAEFRRGAIEIMEIIGAEKERGKAGGAAGGLSGDGGADSGDSAESGASAAIARALGAAPVVLADGQGSGHRPSGDPDEG